MYIPYTTDYPDNQAIIEHIRTGNAPKIEAPDPTTTPKEEDLI